MMQNAPLLQNTGCFLERHVEIMRNIFNWNWKPEAGEKKTEYNPSQVLLNEFKVKALKKNQWNTND